MSTDSSKLKRIVGYVCSFIAIVWMLILIAQARTADIWYDEVFSVEFASRSLKDMILLAIQDVHPPFYYIYLKLFYAVGTSILDGACLIQFLKVASALPWLLLCIIAFIYIRKEYGELTMGIWMLLISGMPQIASYYVEIRMYSLAMLTITVAVLIALDIYKRPAGVAPIKWVMLFLSGIITAYTQYYALVAIAGVYCALGIVILLKRIDIKRNIIALVLCAVLSVLSYLPWLPSFISQATRVGGSYWIQPLTLRSIAGCIKYIIMPVTTSQMANYIATVLVIMVCVLTFCMSLVSGDFRNNILGYCLCFSPLLLVIVSGIVLSLIGTPIFVYRYMIPCLGALWLAIAVMMSRVLNEKVLLAATCGLLVCCVISSKGVFDEEHKKVQCSSDAFEALEAIPDGSVVITNFDHVAAVCGYYLKNCSVYLYDSDCDRLIPQMLNGNGSRIEPDEVYGIVRDSDNVYFFGSFNSREDIVEDWDGIGVESSEVSDFLLERYWIRVYEERVK